MKVIIRISMFVALYVATCACTKEVTFHRNDIEPQLMLNAQVVAGDTLHTVYMAISRNDRIGLVSISTPHHRNSHIPKKLHFPQCD